MLKTTNAEPQITRWTDNTWNERYMSGVGNYWMGWGSVCLGVYMFALWLIETFTDRISTDQFTYISTFLAGAMFFGVGLLGISMARNLANRARVIDFFDDGFQIEFWWRGRRKNIKFTTADVESVEPCQKEKGIIELLAKLPKEPICYQIQVHDQPGFIVTGTDEAIHDVVKRFLD